MQHTLNKPTRTMIARWLLIACSVTVVASQYTWAPPIGFDPNYAAVPVHAKCQPTYEVVELRPSYAPEHADYFPPSTLVKRCTGVCASDLKCQPGQKTSLEYSINETILFDGKEDSRMVDITVEEHEDCTCDCYLPAEACPEVATYNHDECRCVCPPLLVAQCEESYLGKTFLGDTCTCECFFENMECMAGEFYNRENCACNQLSMIAGYNSTWNIG